MSYHTRGRQQTATRTTGQQTTPTRTTTEQVDQRMDTQQNVQPMMSTEPVVRDTTPPPTTQVRPPSESDPRDLPQIDAGESPIVQAGLYTSGGEYVTMSGTNYVGFYHRHQNGVLMLGRGRVGVIHPIKPDEVLTPVSTTLVDEETEVEERDLTPMEKEMKMNFGQVYDYSSYPFPSGFPEQLLATHRSADGYYTCPPNHPPDEPISVVCYRVYTDRNRDSINRTKPVVLPNPGKIQKQLKDKIKQQVRLDKRTSGKRNALQKIKDQTNNRGKQLIDRGIGRNNNTGGTVRRRSTETNSVASDGRTVGRSNVTQERNNTRTPGNRNNRTATTPGRR